MSEIFALDADGQRQAAETAAMNPYNPALDTPGFFEGAFKSTGMGVMRGGAAAARAIDILAAAPVAAYEKLTGQEGRFLDDWYKSVDETAGSAIDFWTPNAHETGAAGRVLGGFAEMVLPLAATAGNPALLLAQTQTNAAADLVNQGVDAQTANQVALLQGAATAVGFRLPFLGKSLLPRVLTGAGGNLALNTTAAFLTQQKLQSEGYDAQAQQFDPANLEARFVDVLSGAAFGALAHIGSPRVPKVVKDAALTADNAKHFQQDTAPGEPVDLESFVAHQDAMESATKSLLTGEPVVAPPAVTEGNFTQRPASAPAELPPDLVKLDQALEEPATRELPQSTRDEIASAPVPEATRTQLLDMYQAAHEVKPAFDKSVREIAAEVGSPHEPQLAPVKGVERAVEKTVTDYEGNASRLKDLVRATLVVNDLHQAQAAVDAAAQKYGAITKYRDTLHSPLETPDGYRDINMNVMINGHIAELQVNLPEMLKAKKELHPLYEERRTLAGKGSELSPADAARIAELNDTMRTRYQAAWAESTRRLKEASSTGEPSSIAQDKVTGRPSGEGTSNARVLQPPSGVGKQATGIPPTSKNTGSLPITGALDTKSPPTGDSLSKSTDPGESLIRAAREAILQNPELKVSTGETAPDGSGATMSAADMLAKGDAEIAQAKRDAAGFEAAVNCLLANGG